MQIEIDSFCAMAQQLRVMPVYRLAKIDFVWMLAFGIILNLHSLVPTTLPTTIS